MRPALSAGVITKGIRAGRGGFSIIEVLVSSVILIVALMGFLSVAISATNLDGKNKDQAKAIILLHDKYEELKNTTFSTIAASTESNIDLDIVTGAPVAGKFNRTVTVAAIDGTTPTTVAVNLTITISWPGHSISQTSIIMKP